MPKTYPALPIVTLKPVVTYWHPQEPSEVIHWEDPALNAMVDFKYFKAATISPEESLDAALMGVKSSPYHVLLVVDPEQHIIGLVSAEDLLGEKPLKTIQDRRLARADLTVRMVMVPHRDIMTLDLEQLKHAKVGHLIETLRAHKQHFALVVKVDEAHNGQIVRGLFSAAQISKQLGQDITGAVIEAHSLAELQHHLHLPD